MTPGKMCSNTEISSPRVGIEPETSSTGASADPEGGGTGGPDPSEKSQVIWDCIGNKQLDPPWKKLDPPPGKSWNPSETLKNDSFL